MTWIRIDDAMLSHPKWLQALRHGGDGALHLWLQLTLWSSRHLTDGVIPAAVLADIPGPRGAMTLRKAWQALAEVGLIERRSNGDVVLHDYLEYQQSRDDVLSERRRKTQNQQDHRLKKRVTGDKPVAENERHHGPSHPIPLDPIPRERDPDPDARAPEFLKPDGLEALRAFDGEVVPAPVLNDDGLELLREWIPIVPPQQVGDQRLTGFHVTLPPSKREQARDARAGVVPGLIYAFSPDWDPSPEHRARGLELGLTDEQILERAEHCRRKAYPNGIRSEDDQFHRELLWMRNDLERNRFKDANARRRFENPGSDRSA